MTIFEINNETTWNLIASSILTDLDYVIITSPLTILNTFNLITLNGSDVNGNNNLINIIENPTHSLFTKLKGIKKNRCQIKRSL
jgi:hypothetical protein